MDLPGPEAALKKIHLNRLNGFELEEVTDRDRFRIYNISVPIYF